jgi:hypothetical protein
MTERGATEAVVERAAVAWPESVGWAVNNGAQVAPGEPAAESDEYVQVGLEQLERLTLLPTRSSGERKVRNAGRFIGEASS